MLPPGPDDRLVRRWISLSGMSGATPGQYGTAHARRRKQHQKSGA